MMCVCVCVCVCVWVRVCVWVGGWVGGWRAHVQVLSAQDGSELKELFYDARCDIDSVVFCDADHQVEAVVVDYTKQEWVVQHDRIKQDVEALQAKCSGTLNPKPPTPNPQPPNPHPQTPNPKPQTPNPKP
jgi:hypothetical protein